ncbi:MAG TPA: P-loop NTPase fold protein [Nocardioides sp.]|uniref:KAP family P-loop NTPase fold protein n=1 Tax=Nocardioides sp. TaxID=35761 RepID=UPI002ED92455
MIGGRSKRTTQQASTLSAGSDLILDTALRDAGQDRFDHEAIARVVADLTLNATPPVNIALFGPWGSGKSSFFGLLDERLADSGHKVKVARYDAWKYGGRALKKHFVGSVAEALDLGGDDFDERLAHDQEVVRLDLWSWAKENKVSLFVGAGLAICIALVWFFLVSLFMWVVDRDGGFSNASKSAVTTVGTVLSLSFAALVFGPKVLESAVVKVKEAAPETDDEFAKSFKLLVDQAINTQKGERLVVFIDELDRCSPKDVVATLIDLKTFLDVEGCIFIVAADREVLERSLREVPQANPVRDEDPYYSTPGAFLDKIFQHQIPLPPLRPQALTRFARELVETQGGLWEDLRAAEPDDRLFLRVVFALVPVHVRSPRRVKVLLNNYATNVRIAEARGINWAERATELACLTVLETEFPAVAADLVRIPRLLAYLRGEDYSTTSKEVQRVVEGYRLGAVAQDIDADTAVPEDTQAAGALLVDHAADPEAKNRANRVLNAHMRSYLRKIAAQDIPDPRPDLFYLQSAGQNDGLTDPDLGYAIDFAADLAPTEVVEAFANQPSATIATGVRMLVQQAEAERGPGRTSIVEAACRLVERLDRDDLEAIAPVAAGGVLADVDSPDWSREATPGALLLGVIGARSDLMSRLLRRDPARDLAKDGLLSRLSPVLAFANDEQAALVHAMLGTAYYRYPQPMHDALNALPLDPALRLWAATAVHVADALTDLVPTPKVVTPATQTTAAAKAVEEDEEDDKPTDTASERFAALLTAVEGRSDGAGALASQVLELGQRSDDKEVRTTVRAREDDALALVTDRARLNLHALLGIERAPIGDVSFWTEKLSDAETHPEHALRAFKRVVNALDDASADDRTAIAEAATVLISHMTNAEAPQAGAALTAAVDAFEWTDADQEKERDIVYGIANDARPLLGDQDVDDMLAKGIADALNAAAAEGALIKEAVNRTTHLTSSSAARLEEHLASATAAPVATLRLRLAAASRTGTNITAADLLAVKDEEAVGSEPVSEWLGLRPGLAEVTKVLNGGMSVYIEPLGRYAATLDIDDRTNLWIYCEQRGHKNLTLRHVGSAGVASAAIEHIATKVAAATQQTKRDDLIARLLEAKFTEQPAHTAATDLAQQLLATGINGDAALAARVAIASGGAAYGKVVAIRNAFDSVVATKPKAIPKGDQDRLRTINLLSRPKKTQNKAASAVKGAIDSIFGGQDR